MATPKKNTYFVGRYAYNDGVSGITAVKIGRSRENALDALPPTMYEVVEVTAPTAKQAKLEFAARFFGVS